MTLNRCSTNPQLWGERFVPPPSRRRSIQYYIKIYSTGSMKKYNDDENINNNIAYLLLAYTYTYYLYLYLCLYTLLKFGYNQLTIILITALQPFSIPVTYMTSRVYILALIVVLRYCGRPRSISWSKTIAS